MNDLNNYEYADEPQIKSQMKNEIMQGKIEV